MGRDLGAVRPDRQSLGHPAEEFVPYSGGCEESLKASEQGVAPSGSALKKIYLAMVDERSWRQEK